MTAHPPPVPPDQQRDHGADSRAPKGSTGPKQEFDSRRRDAEEQGQPANTRQNTTNKGYQQDR